MKKVRRRQEAVGRRQKDNNSSEFGDINAAQNKANDIELGYALQLERVYALRTQNLMQQQGKDNK